MQNHSNKLQSKDWSLLPKCMRLEGIIDGGGPNADFFAKTNN